MDNLLSKDNYEKPTIFILDIETKPQEDLVSLCQDEIKPSGVLKDPEKILLDIESKKLGLKKKMSVDPDFADIICIGVKRVGDYEARLLTPKEMEKFFKDYPYAHFITFNGKNFDIPLLIKVGIKKGLDYPYIALKDMCARYKTHNYHTDLMELICPGEYKSLDLLLQIYCGTKKIPIDFNIVSEEEIKQHCLEDLKNTELLYHKFKQLL